MKATIKRCVCWLWQRGLISFCAGYRVITFVGANEA